MKKKKPKKSLGQHFLNDSNILHKIIETSFSHNFNNIIEIGPGTGNLTQLLINKYSNITAFELDNELIPILQNKFNTKKLNLIHKDFLQVNLSDFAKNEKITVYGNIPYYITNQIVYKLTQNHNIINSAFLLMQKEVAQRLSAKPKNKQYGIPTIFAQLVSTVEILFDVPPQSFNPPPKVQSSFISLDFSNPHPLLKCIENFDLFSKLVKNSFKHRRKKLKNNIQNFNIPKNVFSEFEDKRAEELSIPDFYKIYKEIV